MTGSNRGIRIAPPYLAVSDLALLYKPSPCERRPYLFYRSNEVTASLYARERDQLWREIVGAYPQLLAEREESLPNKRQTQQEAEAIVRSYLADKPKRNGPRPIWDMRLKGRAVLDGLDVQVFGRPRRLVPRDGSWIITALPPYPVAGKVAERIARQLRLYGWLFESMFGKPALRLEIWNEDEPTEIAYDGGASAQADLELLWSLATAETEPYSPVGNSKCKDCVFKVHCLPEAERVGDIALIAPSIDWALGLREAGIETVHDLLATFDERSLVGTEISVGGKDRTIGADRAFTLIRKARVIATGEPEWKAKPELPTSANYVMFDVEDDRGEVYLWGLQVFGERPGKYVGTSDWAKFLAACRKILGAYGNMPILHFGAHEASIVTKYRARYPATDPDTAAAVASSLVDLHAVTKTSAILTRYGLKEVEKIAGYRRKHPDLGATWSLAVKEAAQRVRLEAAVAAAPDERAGRRLRIAYGFERSAGETPRIELDEGSLPPEWVEAIARADREVAMIEVYNREDLEATWAVTRWLLDHRDSGGTTPT